ncbi:hypothetical protein PV683_23550 [Streptomyces sp. AK08-01B]|nr:MULTISPECIES: hypothetical protein [unclassified Streptomyces]MDX2731390.1 hypothetical protein [Streptomyces sp. PA03-2a]MDX3768686.1 hypothetical protein [Streptomyces sp. AK08-01B]MDX3818620.1 hypothetical protein [Streptomyces sp. AK08-01A]
MPATAAGEDPDAADASLRGTAGELLLALYDRVPVDSPKLDATDASSTCSWPGTRTSRT